MHAYMIVVIVQCASESNLVQASVALLAKAKCTAFAHFARIPRNALLQ